METTDAPTPRILILESDRQTCASLRRSVIKGWRGASVQTHCGTLQQALRDPERLVGFDVLLAGCDFALDGSAVSPTLRAVRALSANPASPPIVLLTSGGSEYTAVQAMKAGAFDYVPKEVLGRERLLNAVQDAMTSRRSRGASGLGALGLFGYDVGRCLSRHDNVSVHVAYSAERSAEVVVKVLHRGRRAISQDRSFQSLIDEFKLLHDVDDPAVPEIYDFRVTPDYCYMAMEYFPDGHLGRMLSGTLDPERALSVTREIAQALSIIHAAGIVHRDLKPSNVMLRHDGSVALIDFGISRSTLIQRARDDTLTERIDGTPYYMSPEQAGGAETDERTDLYSLGVILYQMLTGEKPYTGQDALSILEQHREAPVPRLPARLGQYQGLLDRLLAKCARQRPASARELIEAIERIDLDAQTDRDVPLAL